MKPNSVQVPDPDVERTLDVVAKIASGALDLNDPWITQYFYEDDGTLSSSDGEEDETICSEMFGESDSDSDSDYDDDDDDFDNDSSDISESDNISQMLERYDRSKKKKMSAVSWPNNERSNSRGSTAVMSSFSMVVDRTPSQRSLLMVD
uniref:Uncharacterized protein n=1 Tax=Craspedostauros australis TaxID=1486917 RepID=A0A7R9WY33_9STRA|eukprot:CAMPEP_0198112168 /NCGR_PEP_ID=MMETSP1442-20131203/4060_1 /TAXON_ID= /ORGANISM="Craspedostauros australis, Strain CCMP3328" /LENGTH=148 /DNA_ID=CAMNT_0043768859 /DNA_START=56 /DNA_END=502 /DNA_ORIENTATION=-